MLSIEYRYFYQSAIDSSFRKAADNLNINSSAVVRQVHKLEDNLQLKLFIRSSKGSASTLVGKYLKDEKPVILGRIWRVTKAAVTRPHTGKAAN